MRQLKVSLCLLFRIENQSPAVSSSFFTRARMRKQQEEHAKHVCFNISSLIRDQQATHWDFYSTRLVYYYFITESLPLFFFVFRSASILHANIDDINDPRRIMSACPRTLHRAVLRKATGCIGRISGRSPKRSPTLFLPSFLLVPPPSCFYKFPDTTSSNLASRVAIYSNFVRRSIRLGERVLLCTSNLVKNTKLIIQGTPSRYWKRESPLPLDARK